MEVPEHSSRRHDRIQRQSDAREGAALSDGVRPARPADRATWERLRTALWPDVPNDHPAEIAEHFANPPASSECLVAEVDGEVVGFAEVGLRNYAEDCRTSPVGYLEGIYVEEAHRSRGVGRTLVAAAEEWARGRGCTEMASDRELANEPSGAFHAAVGFDETVRIVCYKKAL